MHKNLRPFHKRLAPNYYKITKAQPSIVASYVSDKSNVIEFYISEVKIDRNDGIAVRNKILSITSAEIKRIKINKSALWYRQKAIKEGKRIKLYEKIKK